MPQKLFEQDLKTELGDDDRLPSGIPGLIVGCDNIKFSAFFAQIASKLIRSNIAAIVAGSQDITFSSDFGTADYALLIYDTNGIGVEVTAQYSDKFTIESLGTGNIIYLAIKKV